MLRYSNLNNEMGVNDYFKNGVRLKILRRNEGVKKFIFKILIIILLFVSFNRLYSQQMNDDETVQYIQNTFYNYRFFSGNPRFYCHELRISYDNPKVIISYKKNNNDGDLCQISFNINDVTFGTYKEELIIRCGSCIAYKARTNSTFVSNFNFIAPEGIVATRLKNAFDHLKSMSGKGKSAPDPFDNPVSKSTSPPPQQQTTTSSSTIPSTSNKTITTSTVPSTNSSTQTSQTNNTSTVPNVITYTNKLKGLSIDYPRGWEITEDQMQNTQFVSFMAPLSGTNFRTNFNVIVSRRTESVDVLFQMTQKQNNANFPEYKLNEKEYLSINGASGIKQIASYKLNGFEVKGIQYILKKTDNTVYTITFTIWEQNYNRDKNLLDSIIQTFKPL